MRRTTTEHSPCETCEYHRPLEVTCEIGFQQEQKCSWWRPFIYYSYNTVGPSDY